MLFGGRVSRRGLGFGLGLDLGLLLGGRLLGCGLLGCGLLGRLRLLGLVVGRVDLGLVGLRYRLRLGDQQLDRLGAGELAPHAREAAVLL